MGQKVNPVGFRLGTSRDHDLSGTQNQRITQNLCLKT